MKKKKAVILVLLLYVTCTMYGVTVESDSLRNFLYGEAVDCTYDNWVSHITEGIAREGYNIYSPWEEQTEGFGEFRVPDETELLEWGAVYASFINQDLEEAEALIDSFGFPYEVVDFTDLESGRNLIMLRENINDQYYDDNGTEEEYDDETGSFDYGWGLYIFNPEATLPVIISTPHPNDDYITVPVSLDCFLEWDAMFWFISGAGREVEWTEVGSYTNGKSLSDPTRNDEHPLVVACRQATDYIRTDHRKEFSAQIHSYDWNRHVNLANCQVSVVQSNPNLPTRDLSDLHHDLINQGDYLMIPAGEYGNEYDCHINDYYAVNYSLYPFYFVSEDTTLVVNNDIDLPGVGGAFREYAEEDWNSYDVYDPFFHMEMDELPNEFTQNTYQLKTFYGYDYSSEAWNRETRYDKVRAWYGLWVSDMAEILPEVLELDDGLEPVAVDSLWCTDFESSSIELHWQPEPCYDFYTYRVFIDTEPIDPETSPYYDRDTDLELASPLADQLNIGDLEINTGYYIQIASLDYNDNVNYSNELLIYTIPAIIGELEGIGLDDYCRLYWEAEQQSGNQGFNVYRRIMPDQDWELHAGWESDTTLVSNNTNGQDFIYTDEDVDISGWYEYKLSVNNAQGTEFFLDQEVLTYCTTVYQVYFNNAGITDSISFCSNEYASDGYDEYFDEISSPYLGEELYTRINHPDWTQHWYKRDIRDHYDLDQTWKTWAIEIRSQFEEGEILDVQLDNEFPAEAGIYLKNNYTGELLDLNDEIPDEIAVSGVGSASLQLHVGDVQPDLEIIDQDNMIYQAGDEVTTEVEILFPQLIDYFTLFLYNGTQQVVIIDSLTEINESIVWTAPEEVTIHEAQIRILYHSITGNFNIATSDYDIGIVPQEYSYDLTTGWHNVSSVWTDGEFAVEDIFGTEAELYEWNAGAYQEVDSLEYGKGYWLDLPEECHYSGNGDILSDDLTILLQPGWNLLPNPHPASLSINGLLFQYFTWTYSYRQIVMSGSISKQIYAYRDSIFESVTEVEAGESFYVYNFRDSAYSIVADIVPYNEGMNLPVIIPRWQVDINLSQVNDNSRICMGSVSNSSDDFDVLYDFPALPAKPGGDGCQIYLSETDINYPVSRFHTLFCEPFDDGGLRSFDFVAKGSPDENLDLYLDLDQISLDYYYWLEVGQEIYDLDMETEFSFEPDEAGMVTGTLNVEYPRVWDYGNVDKDGGVEAYDGAIVLQYSVGIEPIAAPLPWDEWRLITADVDGNQTVDSYDAALILQYCIEIITEFPVEQRQEYTAPEGDISIVQSGNDLSIYSRGNVYSLDLEIPAIVTKALTGDNSLLWADNQNENYKFAFASPEELESGNLIVELKMKRQIKAQEISLKINGRETECKIESEEIPFITELYPVSPNPFVMNNVRSEMKIDFAVSEPAKVDIKIYNIKGQKVKTLTNQEYNSGLHSIRWQIKNDDGRQISSGVYFLTMDTGGYRSQRKFIILK